VVYFRFRGIGKAGFAPPYLYGFSSLPFPFNLVPTRCPLVTTYRGRFPFSYEVVKVRYGYFPMQQLTVPCCVMSTAFSEMSVSVFRLSTVLSRPPLVSSWEAVQPYSPPIACGVSAQ
jgi:hypothetical protein